MKQLLTSTDIRLIDKEADGYVLAEEYIDRLDTGRLIGDNFTILPDVLEWEDYKVDREYIVGLATKWTEVLGARINEMKSLSLESDELKLILLPPLQNIMGELYAKYKKFEHIRNEDIYMLYVPMDMRKKSALEVAFALLHSIDYHSSLWAYMFDYYRKPIKRMALPKRQTPKQMVDRGVYLTKMLFQHPDAFANRLKNKKKIKKAEKNIDIPEIDAKTILVGSRMPVDFEEYFIKESNGQIVCLPGDNFVYRLFHVMEGISFSKEQRRELMDGLKDQAEDEFEKLFLFILEEYLPLSVFEGIAPLVKDAAEISSKWYANKIYHSSQFNDMFQAVLSQMKKRYGVTIYDIQHSQAYAYDYISATEESELCDSFITWGWQSSDLHLRNIKPVAMNRLPIRLSRTPCQKTDKILFASCKSLMLTTYGTGYRFGRYVKNQKRFIDALPERLRKRLVIRTDIPESDSDLKMWCLKKYPYIKFESLIDKSFSDSLLESSLLICDYYGSPHMEALMLGKPFVMFNSTDMVKVNDPCLLYFEKMKGFGIYHNDAQEMAKEIGKHEDFDAWLLDDGVQHLFEEYKNEMTGANKDIRQAWYRELLNEEESKCNMMSKYQV